MSKKRSYIGGHTLLVQRRSDFEAELERKAVSAKKRAAREQAAFDNARARMIARNLAKVEALNRAAEIAAAERRAESKRQVATKIRRAPRSSPADR
jgi:hypothetical protein